MGPPKDHGKKVRSKLATCFRGIVCLRLIQFAKSQEVSNVRALQIFEHKVLFSVLNSRIIFERDLRQVASQNLQRKNVGFSETELMYYFNLF